ncbi:MAG: hypothetical protein KDF60_19090 [Calditrichaeota bacterium]|nr:hypothetical protein [Calditrichota bacterium]
MVRKFLASYSSNGKSDTLTLRLFDLLNKRQKALSNKDCAMELFGKDEMNRIRVLKSRLKHKLIDALVTDIVVSNIEMDEDSKTAIILKKKLIQCHLLYFSKKGNTKLISSYLNEIIAKAAEQELYSVLIEAYHLKKLYEGFRKGMDCYDELDQLHHKAINQYTAFTAIVNDYYKVLLKYRLSPGKKEITSFLHAATKRATKNVLISESNIGAYYLNILRYALCIEKHELEAAVAIMENQIVLLNNSKAAYRKDRLGASYDYLCQSNIKLGKYTDAAEYAAKGKTCFKKGELNYSVAEELEFRSYLYGGNISQAEKLIKNMRKTYKDKMDAHRLSTHKFFLANLYFIKKDFSRCKRLLSENDYEFKKNRTGWEFNLRVLYIMCLIEQQKNDEAYDKYYNLNRLITRYKDAGEQLNPRNNLILQLLKRWLSHGGNKSLAKMKQSGLLEKISQNKNRWDPLGSEIIDFHDWFKNQL